MSIIFVKGDMFGHEVHSDIRVNTVNTIGVMGKGIAFIFKKRYPTMFDEYKEYCNKKLLIPGGLFITFAEDYITVPQYKDCIVCFATKDHWKDPSQYEWIGSGLNRLQKFLSPFSESTTIQIPPLGCGNGGLDWRKVKEMIKRRLDNLQCQVTVYEPLEE